MNDVRYAQITGWGMSVPERVLTNDDLARVVDTNDDWIVSRTGIHQRHVVANERETTLSLSTRAARAALRVAHLAPAQVDLIIVATATPEYIFPTTASLLQDVLGAPNAGAFDLSAGCSGFLYAMSVASQMIRAKSADHILIIGAETLSRVTDWTDRNTCVLFGDGAGAVVLSACNERCGVLATILGSDGSGGNLLILPAGGSRIPASHETVSNGQHFIKMIGRDVFRFATTIMPKATEQVMQKAGWEREDLTLIIPHQANIRIIDSAAKRLKLPREKFFVNLEQYGNTSAASIPIALCEAIQEGRVKSGDKLVLVAFGAGLTWAAAAIEWGVPVPSKPQPWPRRWLTTLQFRWAAIRSLGLRIERGLYNWILGPIGKEDWRGKLRQRVDHWREQIRQRRDRSE